MRRVIVIGYLVQHGRSFYDRAAYPFSVRISQSTMEFRPGACAGVLILQLDITTNVYKITRMWASGHMPFSLRSSISSSNYHGSSGFLSPFFCQLQSFCPSNPFLETVAPSEREYIVDINSRSRRFPMAGVSTPR